MTRGDDSAIALCVSHSLINANSISCSVAFVFMDYSTEELPQDCIDAVAGAVGCNFATRNARFRAAVCRHFNLEWISVGGNGNCFFVSVITALKSSGVLPRSSDLSAHQLRLDLVGYFRLCCGSTQPLCERVVIEIEAEQHDPLLCSTHAKIDAQRLNGFVPGSTERYLDAVSNNGVWPQGFHWFRGVSYLYNVRVAVIIFGNNIVRFFGQGDVTLYLYKFDAETHYDPLVPLRADAGVVNTTTADTCTLPQSETAIIISSTDDDIAPSPKKAPLPKQPPATALDGVHSSSRPKRTCRIKCTHSSSSSSESDVAPLPKQPHATASGGVHSSSRPKSSDESERFFEGITFKAKDSSDAKIWLAKSFDDNHSGGHIRCVNSRWNYVYLECKRCLGKCAASLQGSKWVVSKAPSSGPCTGVSSSAHLPPAAAPVETSLVVPGLIECCICFNADVPIASTVSCRNAGKHAYCLECFGNLVKNLCEKRAEFMKDEGRIFCMKCRMDGNPSLEDFDMQAAGAK